MFGPCWCRCFPRRPCWEINRKVPHRELNYKGPAVHFTNQFLLPSWFELYIRSSSHLIPISALGCAVHHSPLLTPPSPEPFPAAPESPANTPRARPHRFQWARNRHTERPHLGAWDRKSNNPPQSPRSSSST